MAEKAARLVRALAAVGDPAKTATVPIDIMWSTDAGLHMYDLKRPGDAIKSALDGRLHSQLQVMRDKKAVSYGFIIEWEGDEADAPVVGDGVHTWPAERFDNLMNSLEEEGAKIVNARPGRLVQRIHALYTRSKNAARGSWHAPQPHKNLNNRYTHRTYRAHIEQLMNLPGLGEQKANDLLDRWPLTDILGITPEGLEQAAARWKLVKGVGAGNIKAWHQYLLEDFSSATLRKEAEDTRK